MGVFGDKGNDLVHHANGSFRWHQTKAWTFRKALSPSGDSYFYAEWGGDLDNPLPPGIRMITLLFNDVLVGFGGRVQLGGIINYKDQVHVGGEVFDNKSVKSGPGGFFISGAVQSVDASNTKTGLTKRRSNGYMTIMKYGAQTWASVSQMTYDNNAAVAYGSQNITFDQEVRKVRVVSDLPMEGKGISLIYQ